jgi:hypothetical protein
MTTSENIGQSPDRLTAYVPYESAHGRAAALVALFVAFVVVKLGSLITNFMELALPPVLLGGDGADEPLALTDLLHLLIFVATVAAFVAVAVAFLVWLHRANKNLPALGNSKSKIEYTPGWAVGTFFIPIGNLFLPYRVVSEVWRKSDPDVVVENGEAVATNASSQLLLGWWASWVALTVVNRIANRMERNAERVDLEGLVSGLGIFVDLLGITAAVLAVFVVREIDRRQEARARRVTYVPDTPGPPPPLPRPPRASAAPPQP